MDSDWMAMHSCKGKEGGENPLGDARQVGVIKTINDVDMPRKGGELKNLGTDGESHGRGQNFVGVHLED